MAKAKATGTAKKRGRGRPPTKAKGRAGTVLKAMREARSTTVIIGKTQYRKVYKTKAKGSGNTRFIIMSRPVSMYKQRGGWKQLNGVIEGQRKHGKDSQAGRRGKKANQAQVKQTQAKNARKAKAGGAGESSSRAKA